MAAHKKHEYSPDYAVPPGATLAETLKNKSMSQAELSLRTGLAEKTISQIINGVAPITYDTALKLEAAFGVPARFWNNLERNYQEGKAEIQQADRLEEDLEWLKEIPVRTLVQRGFIEPEKDKVQRLKSVLAFFGVANVDSWLKIWDLPEAAFRRRKSTQLHLGLVATWLRMGELAAESISCKPYNAERFRESLRQARSLTLMPLKWQEKLVELCSDAGVAVVFVPEIPRAGISGATRWLSKDRALIQLSLMYKNDASLWFTVFHEAGHVLLHGKKEVFLEGADHSEDAKEREADEFTRNFLIPRNRAKELPHLKSRPAIQEFAKSLGIAPGIVVGRLQHDKFAPHSAFNDLKRKLSWETSDTT